MLWMIPLATAALGAMEAKKKQEAQEEHNKAQAELTRYSPWTGMKGQLDFSAPSVFGGAMSGGVAGLGMAQGIGGMQGGWAEPSNGVMNSTNMQPNLYQQNPGQMYA